MERDRRDYCVSGKLTALASACGDKEWQRVSPCTLTSLSWFHTLRGKCGLWIVSQTALDHILEGLNHFTVSRIFLSEFRLSGSWFIEEPTWEPEVSQRKREVSIPWILSPVNIMLTNRHNKKDSSGFEAVWALPAQLKTGTCKSSRHEQSISSSCLLVILTVSTCDQCCLLQTS